MVIVLKRNMQMLMLLNNSNHTCSNCKQQSLLAVISAEEWQRLKNLSTSSVTLGSLKDYSKSTVTLLLSMSYFGSCGVDQQNLTKTTTFLLTTIRMVIETA